MIPKAVLLALIVKQNAQSGTWVVVPEMLCQKARGLVRDGSLIPGPNADQFVPSKIGILMAGEIE